MYSIISPYCIPILLLVNNYHSEYNFKNKTYCGKPNNKPTIWGRCMPPTSGDFWHGWLLALHEF